MESSRKLVFSLGLFKSLLNDSWQVFANRWWRLVKVLLLPSIFVGIWVSALVLGFTATTSASFFDTNSFLVIIIGILIVLLVSLPAIVVSLWAQVTLLYDILKPNNLTIKELFLETKKYIAEYFVVSFLVGLFIFLGLPLLVVPAFIFAIWFIFSPFVYLDFGVTGNRALRLSREYVKGNGWFVFWSMVFFILLVMIASLLLGLVPLIGDFLTTILSIAVSIFQFVFVVEIYKRIKDTKGDISGSLK